VSIPLKETLDRLANAITSTATALEAETAGTSSEFHTSIWFVTDPGKADREYGPNGGLYWRGDGDDEYIFGTSWLDKLYGGAGSDKIYGFEGNDIIYGGGLLFEPQFDGNDVDILFGDAGDDKLYAHGLNSVLSGGSGNDELYNLDASGSYGDTQSGDSVNQMALFGGPGHDLLWGG
jgi:Ca2+-binding RTX toxin-like protein